MEELFLILGVLGLLIAAIAILPMLNTPRRWLAAVAAILGVLSLTHAFYLHQKRDEITPDNVESKISEWLTASGMKNGKFVQPPQGCSFAYDVELPDGNGLSICRPSAAHESKYLLFSTRINLSDEYAAFFDKQDQPTRTYFANVLGIEAGRAKLDINLTPPYHSMLLFRKMLISGITEHTFSTAIQDHHMACHLMLSTIDNLIADMKMAEKSTQPSPTPSKGASRH